MKESNIKHIHSAIVYTLQRHVYTFLFLLTVIEVIFLRCVLNIHTMFTSVQTDAIS